MLKFAHVVFIGNRSFGKLESPTDITFPKGVPIGIDDRLLSFIPTEDFEVFDPAKHDAPENIKPILFPMPRTLKKFLACIQSLRKLREKYPYTPIEIITNEDFKPLLEGIDNLDVKAGHTYRPMDYYEKYELGDAKTFGALQSVSLKELTEEFGYLLYFSLITDEVKNKPTLVKMDLAKTRITIINTGSALGTFRKELGDYLGKQDWGCGVDMIESEKDFTDNLEKIQQSKIVISTGDSELSMLAGYIGVPVFAIMDNITSDLTWQLDKFNNNKSECAAYAKWNKKKTPKEVFEIIKPMIEKMMLHSPISNYKPNKENSPKQSPRHSKRHKSEA